MKFNEGTRDSNPNTDGQKAFHSQSTSLPKGGGAIRGIGEKFAVNPVIGTGSMTIPIAVSPGRSGFSPLLSLSYNSGSGNSPFGFGWSLSLPEISRKTEKGLPQYWDGEQSDGFILSGAEDLVQDTRYEQDAAVSEFIIHRYRPRIEGSFARIERWTRKNDGDVHWRSISRDNMLTLYGKDDHSRIFGPTDTNDPHHKRIFSWLISETRDDKGNAIVYEYKAEDGAGVKLDSAHERNRGDRNDPRRSTNRYLKRIRYGNRVPLLDSQGLRPRFLTAELISQANWMFEAVLDYGEHHESIPKPYDKGQWHYRNDPFSNYKPGFEVRTCRTCKRVLMFHHFEAEAGVGNDCLVLSTEFGHTFGEGLSSALNSVYTFLSSVTQSGYKRDGDTYIKRSFPAVEFAYSMPAVQENIETVEMDSLENLPIGLDESIYQWIDLHGEGIPGILSEQGDGWFYKRNLSPVSDKSFKLAPIERVDVKPNVSLTGNEAQFIDLSGDGKQDLAILAGSMSGYYEHDLKEGWHSYRSFPSLNCNLQDPNARFIDLDGDGHVDVLITEQDTLVWHLSLGEDGFGPAQRVLQAMDEEKGPRLVFSEVMQSIFLADMSGDGLTDLVRIRNNEVCYWPNLGYGRFGSKVMMDDSPCFDHPDQFDPIRIRLVDIDGTGTTDIIYLHGDGVQLYFNESGNRWSAPQILQIFPNMNELSAITAVDLFGNDTACLVWSTSLPNHAGRQMRYVDLMGGYKPHLLTRTINNMGAETRVHYVPSTQFYLADKRNDKPWITRLPFPVHVVERTESIDHISRNRFVTRYAYHHGYYDGREREFRGFGMVEQWDTEVYEDYAIGDEHNESNQEIAPELYQPPVTTRTWYHTGVFLGKEQILQQYKDEYYERDQHLPESTLPVELDDQEMIECVRALKGLPLRQEIYSFDGSAQQLHPYSVMEHTYEVRRIQSIGNQRHAVFYPVEKESISIQYERNPHDPRITHSLNLEIDEYGNLRKSCSVVYGRQSEIPSLPEEVKRDQRKLFITYGETVYTSDIDIEQTSAAYRLRTAYESRSYEITGISPLHHLFRFSEIQCAIADSEDIPYEAVANEAGAQKRLLSQTRTTYLDNNLSPLPLGEWDTLALDHQSYQLALTPSICEDHYAGNVSDEEFAAAGYVHFDDDPNWWIPSGTLIYANHAAAHFYVPIGSKDPHGLETVITLDSYDLLPNRVQMKQALWNETSVVNDYRVLAPISMTDMNKNRTAVEIDALGMVVKTAIMGKMGSTDGDTLEDPTTRLEYNLYEWKNHGRPNYVHTFAREQHGNDNPRWQESYTYMNGSDGIAMVKAQTHPGKAASVQADGNVAEVDADPRWIGNGRVILNNKGKPVKQYEPYFSASHEYETEKQLREIGVTKVLYYDALGRNNRTLLPNGTLVKNEFDPWMLMMFDTNDTVLDSQWYKDRGSPDPAEPEPVDHPERRTAWLAAKHANTPGVVHLDSLGRNVYASSNDGRGNQIAVRSESDLTGRFSKIFDQIGREVSSGFVGMAGTPIYGESAEKGRRWIFQDVAGNIVKTWDEYGRQFRTEYDALQRPVSIYVQETAQTETAIQHIIYGDRHPDAEQFNLLGIAHQIFDQSGMMRVPEADFKGNPKRVERVLAKDYKHQLDWGNVIGQSDYKSIQTAASAALEIDEVFEASAEYDALNRPSLVTFPDATELVPSYNEANRLASLQAKIRGEGSRIELLKKQDYDAKGQHLFAHYGNEVYTTYFYDPNSFRLTQLLTAKSSDNSGTEALQHLHYTYDPVGNVTQILDKAQQTHYFNNAVVKPVSRFEYNAIYQLIRATGREHAGSGNSNQRTHTDLDLVPQLPFTNDATAVRKYYEEYEYDLLGNITELRHRYRTQAGAGSGWTRHYRYAYQSDAGIRTNRLSSTNMPGDLEDGPYSGGYEYDAYGNMTRMPHLAEMDWDSMDQLRQVSLSGGGRAHYVYSADGQRIRKVIERNGDMNLEWIYLGPVQIFRRRRRTSDELRFERWTVQISDNCGLIAQVDTKTRDDDNLDPANSLNIPLIRYQYSNHLGSAVLETDEIGNPISYEEYHPFGTSAYRSSKPGYDLSLKRYRFSGKECDEETGLYYFGARYYAPWLGRWTSTDPAGFVDGMNLYQYCSGNPIMISDPDGTIGIGKLGDLDKDASLIDLQVYALRHGVSYEDPNNERRFNVIDPATGAGSWEGGILTPVEDLEAANIKADLLEYEQLLETLRCMGSGSGESAGSSEAPADEGDASTDPSLAPVPDAARAASQEVARPSSESGKRPNGPLHLWSGEDANAEAKKAINQNKSGWMMDNIHGEPTPQHAKAEAKFEDAMNQERARNPGKRPRLSKGIFDRIWGWSSAEVVGRAAYAGHPVEGHGPTSTEFGQPGYIQGRWERPARMIGGGLAGGLSVGTGLFTAIVGGQDPNPAVAVTSILAGVGETTSGIIYGSAAIAGSAEAMAMGTAGMTFFAGAGAAIGFGTASVRSFNRGDTAGGVMNALGAIGGVLMIASLFTPVGWVGVGLAGVGLVALAAGFNIRRWLAN